MLLLAGLSKYPVELPVPISVRHLATSF
jgi:hypothetical protein